MRFFPVRPIFRHPHWIMRGAVLLAILGMGYLGLSITSAAGYIVQSEAEDGSLAGNVQTVQDVGASGGSAVRFTTSNSNDTCQPIPKTGGGTWQCTFSDEFDGTTLSNTWEAIPYGLGSACLYLDNEHVKVSGGFLQLLATRNAQSEFCYTEYGLEYTGGGIQSQGQFAQSYGRFEIRAKLPAGDGSWPAFWLLPGDDSYDGEIDILESYGGRVEQGGDVGDFTLHVPAAGPGPQRTCRVSPDYSSDYHTYTFEWSATSMRALYDGVECANFTGVSDDGTSPPAFPATFSKPYHILLNLAVQPWWPPTSSTQFPMVMSVDYVRVWQ